MEAYILQVILFQLLFLLVYELLLKKETFFGYNRWYLLLTAIVSLVLPVIKIDALAFLGPVETLSGITNVWLPEVFIGQETGSVEKTPVAEMSESRFIINWWLFTYFVGIFVSLYIVFKKYRNLNRLFRFRTISAKEGVRIIEVPNSSIACTFYNTVFLGDKLSETERLQILTHELVHVKQKHSLDLVFFEVLKIIFWFNPLVYIYQKKIATLHEFIADAAVVKVTEKRSYYEQLLNSAFNTQNISFINQFFNHSLIKKRIVMLQKSKSKTVAKLKYLALVPLMLVMLTYVACSDERTVLEESASEMNVQEDEALKAALWEEITAMDKKGAGFQEITKAFLTEQDEHIKSKEAYYRSHALYRLVHQKTVEREKAAGTYDENSKNPFQEALDMSYEEYVIKRKDQPVIEKRSAEQGDDNGMPFAMIDQVPVFPGCEGLGSNDATKECMSEKIKVFVSENFNADLGKEVGLTGVNRVIAIFQINSDGEVVNVRARAPHPDLEEEAKRVIESLPSMIPGKHEGKDVAVSYSLPIVFEVKE